MIKRESAFKSIQWKKPSRSVKLLSLVESGSEPGHDALRAAQVKFGVAQVPGSAREQAIQLLRAAAEIEHQLLVEYLYAAYSLAQTPPAGSTVTAAQLTQWRGTIIGVAKEEMGHLLTVQNLLLLLGAAPYLGRISPASNGLAPFPFKLEPLSLLSLAKYVCAESPDPKTLDPATLQRAQPAYDLAKNNNINVTPVGLIYAQLYSLFQSGAAPEGPWNISVLKLKGAHLDDTDFNAASVTFQGSGDEWGNSSSSLPAGAKGIFVAQAKSRQDALQALHDISVQGEGVSGSTEVGSHFMRFLDVFQNIPRDPADAGRIMPGLIRPFPVDPVYGPASAASPPDNRITDPVSAQWCELLDFQYHLLLAEIALSLTLDADMLNGMRGNYLTSFAIMTEMIGNVARISATIATLPRTKEVPATTASAAPAFSEIDFPPLTDPPNPPDPAKMRKRLALWAKELVDASMIHVQGMLAAGISGNGAAVFPAGGRTTSNQDLDTNVLQPILALP